MAAASATRVWTVHCEQRTHQLQCLLGCVEADNDETCNITYEGIATVDMPGLPRRWHIDQLEYNCMKLPCGHMYHASTVMFHFLVNDMRCPVCRQGNGERASIESVPESMTDVFSTMLEQVQARDQAAVSDELMDIAAWQMSAETIEMGLRLLVEVHCEQSVTVMSSRLIHVAEIADPYHVYRGQQSFYRRLQTHVHSQTSPVTIVCRLWHILLDASIACEPLSLTEYTRICENERPTREIVRRRQLKFENVTCGELLPQTQLQPFACSINREYVHMLLLSRIQEYLAEYAEAT